MKVVKWMDMAVYACNPSTGEVETGGWQVCGQPGLQSKLEASLGYMKKERKREKEKERERKERK